MKNENTRGFTLIELTIVVAIIGILAAIAIPDFLKLQSKAQQSEAKVILGAIASSELQHKLRSGVYLACPQNPPTPGKPWNKKMPEWNDLGFEMEQARLKYQYEVAADKENFIVYARGNVDNDDTLDEWEITSKNLVPQNTRDDVNQ